MHSRIESIGRQFLWKLAAGSQLEPRRRFNSAMRVTDLLGLPIRQLGDNNRPLPGEIGPEGIIAVAEKRCVRTGLLGRTTSRTESPGQADVARERWRSLARALGVQGI